VADEPETADACLCYGKPSYSLGIRACKGCGRVELRIHDEG